jgi:hypothetical protein
VDFVRHQKLAIDFKNWRLTFQIGQQTVEIIDLDYEDYH